MVDFNKAYTVAAASLTGFASNVSGASWTLTATSSGDGLAHPLTVRNDSITDHSGKTILLTGTDADGAAQTETLAAPGISATVTSTKYWLGITSAVPSATIGADTFDIGWAAAAISPWVYVDHTQKVFNVSAAVYVGGTINYDIQHAYDNTYAFDTATSKTATFEYIYTHPVKKMRVKVNSHTSGTFVFILLQ